MMIEPPTGSPNTIEMALAARRIRTRGLAKKRRKAIRGAKRDSPTRLFGPWRRSRCFASAEVSPAGAASSSLSRSRRGISQKRSSVLSGLLSGSLSVDPACCLGLTPRAQGCWTTWGLVARLVPSACISDDTGQLAAAASRPAATAGIRCRFCTLRQWHSRSGSAWLARSPHVARPAALDPLLQ